MRNRFISFSIHVLIAGLVFCFSAAAQNVITGKVVDEETGEPLSFANVYLSNTTIGTSSDPDGNFLLHNIPPGPYELIVQYVGYELFIKKIELDRNSEIHFNVELIQKPIKGDEVVVEAPDAEWWRERFKEFKREFLGPTSFAKDCKILNPHVLEFAPVSKIEGYRVVTDSVLVVENRALGYNVHITLVDFRWGSVYKHPIYQLKLHTRFEPLQPQDDDEQEKWARNRRKAHEGSLRHFLKSLATGTIDNRFTIIKYPRDFLEKQREEFLTVVDRDEAEGVSPEELDVIPYDGERIKKFYLRGLLEVKYLSRATLKKGYLSIQGSYALIDTLGNAYDASKFNVSGDWSETRISGLLPNNYRP